MRNIYSRFTGKTGTRRSWHDYIEALEKAVAAGFAPTAETQTLVYLNQLRNSSRNPIMHPRVVLDETDAFEIFDLGRGAITSAQEQTKDSSMAGRARHACSVPAIPERR